jgi:hypothetical protein
MKWLILLGLVSSLRAQDFPDFVLNALPYSCYQVPVQGTAPASFRASGYRTLINRKTGKIYPLQFENDSTFFFLLTDTIPAGTAARLKPSRLAGTPSDRKAWISGNDSVLTFFSAGSPVLTYQIKEKAPPADSPSYYRRSGFIHPVYSPSGEILTDDFPSSHAHQHGVFQAWVNTGFRKHHLDCWNQQNKEGTVRHEQLISRRDGPVFGNLEVMLSHRSLTEGEVLSETWKIKVFAFTSFFLFELESVQRNTSTDTLFLRQYHYGGMAFRGSSQWDPFNEKKYRSRWQILTSEGLRDSAADQSHAAWVDAGGHLNGRLAGVTVFSDPENFRHPQPVRVHPKMPYWCFAPVIDGPFSMPPGSVYRSRYLYYVHEGSPDTNTLTLLRRQWEQPLRVCPAGNIPSGLQETEGDMQ